MDCLSFSVFSLAALTFASIEYAEAKIHQHAGQFRAIRGGVRGFKKLLIRDKANLPCEAENILFVQISLSYY
jgi:hypothetical protein